MSETTPEPTPEPLPAFATVEDFTRLYPTLADALNTAALEALLHHASAAVSAACLAYFDPSDPTATAALKDATCHQTASWVEVGDTHDLAGYDKATTIDLGDFSIGGMPARLSPRAIRSLRGAGLTMPWEA